MQTWSRDVLIKDGSCILMQMHVRCVCAFCVQMLVWNRRLMLGISVFLLPFSSYVRITSCDYDCKCAATGTWPQATCGVPTRQGNAVLRLPLSNCSRCSSARTKHQKAAVCAVQTWFRAEPSTGWVILSTSMVSLKVGITMRGDVSCLI